MCDTLTDLYVVMVDLLRGLRLHGLIPRPYVVGRLWFSLSETLELIAQKTFVPALDLLYGQWFGYYPST